MAARLERMGSVRYARGFLPTLHPDLLDTPKAWHKPRLIFVNSMSDLFQDEVPLEFIQRVFATIADTPRHTYQVLTKRSQRLAELATALPWPANLWMGVSVEGPKVLHRIEDLRRVPARVRFISAEPLIAPLSGLNLGGIYWVIVGGESGPGARPMDERWAIEIRDQCTQREVPFFFKQWGGVNKKIAGRHLQGQLWEQMPRPAERR